MKRIILLFLFFFLLLKPSYSHMLVYLINNSPCIILGKVVQINEGERSDIARIEIEEVLKGEIVKRQIELPSHNSNWSCDPYPCSYFTLNSRVIVFLVKEDSTYYINNGANGIVELSDKTEPICRQAILDYLKIIENSKNQRFRLNEWEIELIEKDVIFIRYGYNFNRKLTKKQQKRIYDVFKSSDTLNTENAANYGFYIYCYNNLCYFIPIYKDSCSVKFSNQLINTQSAEKADDLMSYICFLKKKRKLLKLWKEFREKKYICEKKGSHIINDEMKRVIVKFVKITNDTSL